MTALPTFPTAEELMAKFQNILETVGNTPVVRINRLAPPCVSSPIWILSQKAPVADGRIVCLADGSLIFLSYRRLIFRSYGFRVSRN